jgi:hypothetical protein
MCHRTLAKTWYREFGTDLIDPKFPIISSLHKFIFRPGRDLAKILHKRFLSNMITIISVSALPIPTNSRCHRHPMSVENVSALPLKCRRHEMFHVYKKTKGYLGTPYFQTPLERNLNNSCRRPLHLLAHC